MYGRVRFGACVLVLLQGAALALGLLLEKGGLVLGFGIGSWNRKWEPQEAASME